MDGDGPASITNLTVDLVTNTDDFSDVYPPSDSDSDSDSSSDSEDEQPHSWELNDLEKQIQALQRERLTHMDLVIVAQDESSLLDHLLSQAEKIQVDDVAAGAKMFEERKKDIVSRKRAASNKVEEIDEKLKSLTCKRDRISNKRTRAKAQAVKEQKKVQAKKRRDRQKRKDNKAKLYAQRAKFWPRRVYKVVVTIEASSQLTPTSSRRGSVESLANTLLEAGDIDITTSLCVTYVTGYASWVPRYDLHITNPSSSGLIVYRAEIRNKTSEQWKGAKVVLSTSQTSFNGLNDAIPELQAWHLRLFKNGSDDLGLQSIQESGSKSPWLPWKSTVPNRSALFGLGPSVTETVKIPPFEQNIKSPSGGFFGDPKQQKTLSGGLFGNTNTNNTKSDGLFGGLGANSTSSNTFGGPAPPANNLFGQPSQLGGFGSAVSSQQQSSIFRTSSLGTGNTSNTATAPMGGIFGSLAARPAATAQSSSLFAATSSDPIAPRISAKDSELPDFSEASWEESGLTAVYEVRGARTIPPSDTPRRLKIASIELSKITLTHICVPKLRACAFLKARVTNTSNITLLKGSAGLTLDNSFLGTVDIPRCEAGDSFPLSLGVDPAVEVEYAFPSVKKNLQSGMLNKQDSKMYERIITIRNTKSSGQPLDIKVQDQVPLSQDERLKIEIGWPFGLRNEGDVIANAGEKLSDDEKAAKKSTKSSDWTKRSTEKNDLWGSAQVERKKGGMIEWKVKLNPSNGVKLLLGYETRYPAGEHVSSDDSIFKK